MTTRSDYRESTEASVATVEAGDDSDPLARELRDELGHDFEVLRKLGDGGMGSVYLARDPGLRRLVAVKVLSPALKHDRVAQARFLREARAAAAVSHPNVVSVFRVGMLPRSRTPYFVMQHVDGAPLRDERTPGGLPEARARRIVGEIASALAAAHALGVVHRDIKPGNVLLDRVGDRAIVLDFGIAAACERDGADDTMTLTRGGESLGTPAYMSPEQALAEAVTPKSDVYSLGILAFELLTGRHPFEEQTGFGMIAAHVKDLPPSVLTGRPELDGAFADTIDRCLAKDPARRPAAADIARALLPTAGAGVEWPPPGLEPIRAAGQRLLHSLAATALVGGTLLALLYLQPLLDWSGLAPLGAAPQRWTPDPAWTQAATPVWIFLLAGVALLAAVFGGLASVRGIGLARAALRGRRAGYPWRVLLDTAGDRWVDTSAILNGSGAFAFAGKERRARLLRFRRLHVGALLAGLILAIAGPVLWLQGWVGVRDVAGVLLTPLEAAVALLPAGVALVIATALRIPEWRVRRRGRRHREGAGRGGVSPEVVAGWLRSARVPAGRLRPPIDALVGVAPVGLVGLLCLTLFLTVAAALGVALLTTQRGVRPAVVDGGVGTIALGGARLESLDWRALDSLLAASARAPVRGAPVDTAASRRFILATLRRDRAGPALALDSAELVPPAGDTAGVSPQAVIAGWSTLPGGLPDSLRERLAGYAILSRLELWRRLARAAYDEPLWSYGYDFFAAPGIPAVPLLDAGAVADFAYGALAAGVLAMDRGAVGAAERQARETIAVGRHLLRDPVAYNSVVGLGVVDLGRFALATIGRVRGDRELIDEAFRLDAAVRHYRSALAVFHRDTRRDLMADPHRLAGLEAVGDRLLPPAVRWGLIRGVVDGYCANGREVLFGVDPLRRAALARAAWMADDLAGTGTWVGFHRRLLEGLIDAPTGVLAGRRAETPPVLAPLGWMGLGGLRDRLRYCRSQVS